MSTNTVRQNCRPVLAGHAGFTLIELLIAMAVEWTRLIEIRFTADRDMDGVLDDPFVADGISESDLERIGYAYDSVSQLEMFLRDEDDLAQSQDILLDNVIGLSFSIL